MKIFSYGAIFITALSLTVASDSSSDGVSKQDGDNMTESMFSVRRGLQDNVDVEAMEMGFAACLIVIFILLLLCCVCCCCFRGSRFSLWDCVALACLWEICCDRNEGIDDFQLCS
jgi:hypothetical protein